MLQRRWWTIAAFVAVLGTTSVARAETASVTAIRNGLADLEARAKVLRPRVERAPPKSRAVSQRMMDVVDHDCDVLTRQLMVIDLLGGPSDDTAIRAMNETMKQAERHLGIVESWYP